MVAVPDQGYGRALEELCEEQGWNVSVQVREFQEGECQRIGKLYVQSLEEAIVDCLKEWAFADAFSALYQYFKKVDLENLASHYWERIPRTDVRIGQVLSFGRYLIERDHALGNRIEVTPWSRV